MIFLYIFVSESKDAFIADLDSSDFATKSAKYFCCSSEISGILKFSIFRLDN